MMSLSVKRMEKGKTSKMMCALMGIDDSLRRIMAA
jgi:hypothetical protein